MPSDADGLKPGAPIKPVVAFPLRAMKPTERVTRLGRVRLKVAPPRVTPFPRRMRVSGVLFCSQLKLAKLKTDAEWVDGVERKLRRARGVASFARKWLVEFGFIFKFDLQGACQTDDFLNEEG